MPPKNKKQLEDQAKRLEEQLKKKEEEEAKLALERMKYAGESLQSKLFLPASLQLFLDFPNKPSAYITQKLSLTLTTEYPTIQSHTLKKALRFLLLQMKFSFQAFSIKSPMEIQKGRVTVGIALRLFLNEAKSQDQKLMKELLLQHSQAGKIKTFNAKDIELVLGNLRNSYFGHRLLLQHYDQFPERVDEKQDFFFMSTPSTFANSKQTPFVNLEHDEPTH